MIWCRVVSGWYGERISTILDELMEDIVEQLFGRAVQEEFEEITQNCPKALTEIKVCPIDFDQSFTLSELSLKSTHTHGWNSIWFTTES